MLYRAFEPFEEVFQDIVRDVEPSPAQKDGAARSHNYLRDVLCTGNMEVRIRQTYLSGSYARHTAIFPLDDVDIIFEIDPSHWRTAFLARYPAPAEVLRTFANAIRYRYDASSVRTQRRSVRLQMNHLDIDVVPAIPTTAPDVILVADTKHERWIESAPARHKALATEINQSRGSRFKPLVKLLKAWNRSLPSTAQFKSFAVETIAAHFFRQERFYSLGEGAIKFFDLVASFGGDGRHRWPEFGGVSLRAGGATVPDTAGSGSNVAAGASRDRSQKFVAAAGRARNRLELALNARTFDSAANHIALTFGRMP